MRISIAPDTMPSKVVCSMVNPNESEMSAFFLNVADDSLMINELWLVKEFGILSSAEKIAN